MTFHIKGIIQYVDFCEGFFFFFKISYVVAHIILHSFLFLSNIPLYEYTTFCFFHSPVDGHLDCLQFVFYKKICHEHLLQVLYEHSSFLLSISLGVVHCRVIW